MRVARLIDRIPVDEGRQIRAVIQVVAPHQILAGLALAAVHGDYQTGNGLDQLAGAVGR